ncbi:MAG: AAA family ATPase [Cyanobium sp.]
MTTSAGPSPSWAPSLAAALAEALPRLHGVAPDPLIGELIAALGTALASGELEVDLAGPAPEAISSEGWPQAHRRQLATSPLAAEPEGPLVLLDGHRLMWRRWQQQRQRVLVNLVARARRRPDAPQPETTAAAELLAPLDGRQREAVQAVSRHGLVLLAGGPGTGKTSTVAAMIAAAQAAAAELRIHLAAPTGKAAARLRSATGGQLPCTTLHRLLESRGGSFGRHRRRPLELDLLVVDEVSMVDLALMEALLDALPSSCRLVLVGDPAQLPPIAPGAVLLDLQRPPWRQELAQAAITLTTTYRNSGAIAAVATALRSGLEAGCEVDPGDGSGSLARIQGQLAALGPEDNLRWIQARPPLLPPELITPLRLHHQRLRDLAEGCGPDDGAIQADLLALRDQLLVLTPVRQGAWGLDAIHRTLLGDLIRRPPLDWPAGTPVLCTRNRPELGLANGDVGILIGSSANLHQRRIVFGSPGLEIAPLHPAQMAGAAEAALALTVHKAQGSEARQVIVLLPPGRGDQRLLYTALTRAREQAVLITTAIGADQGEAGGQRAATTSQPSRA